MGLLWPGESSANNRHQRDREVYRSKKKIISRSKQKQSHIKDSDTVTLQLQWMVRGGSCWHKFLCGDKMTPLHLYEKEEKEENLTKQHNWNDFIEITFKLQICSPRASPRVDPSQAPAPLCVDQSPMSPLLSVQSRGSINPPLQRAKLRNAGRKWVNTCNASHIAERNAGRKWVNPCNASHIALVEIYYDNAALGK